MKNSKQRLATAMAATMVVSMVPAMAFAAPVDDVVKALNSEDTSKAKAGDVSSAEAVLAVAKGFVAGDAKAQLLVDAYQASIDVFKATSVAEWTTKKAAFDTAVSKLTFLNVNRSFKSSQTADNHDKVKQKLAAPAEDAQVKAVETLLKALPEAATITDLAGADAVRAQVKAASDAYEALTAEQKAKVDAALVTKLNALKAKVDTEFPNVEKLVVTTEKAGFGFNMTVTSSDANIVKVQAFELDESAPASAKVNVGEKTTVFLANDTAEFIVKGFDAADAEVTKQKAPAVK